MFSDIDVNVNILDIITVLILIWSIISAYNQGFIKLILQKFSFLGGLILAFLLTSPLSKLVADVFSINAKITSFVTEHINEAKLFSDTTEGHITKGVEQLNNLLDNMSILGQFTKKALQDLDVVSLISSGYYKNELIDMLVDTITTPVMLIVNVCVFFVLLLVGMLVLSMLSNIVSNVLGVIPLVGFANRLIGALFGIVGGIAWSVIFVVVYAFLSMFTSNSNIVNIAMVQGSFIGKIVLDMFTNLGL